MSLTLPPRSPRPEPFSVYTTPDFWNDPHISRRMLEHHLNSNNDYSSRPAAFIDRSVDWIATRFAVGAGTRVLDLGCGPGLYAQRLARLGVAVVGIDVSRSSLRYGRDAAAREGLDIEYVEGSYLDIRFPSKIDLALLIYRDYCALGPQQRRALLGKVAKSLKKGGALLFDVQAASGFGDNEEFVNEEEDLHDAFFAPTPYLGRHERFLYEDARVILDRFTIAETGRTRTFHNWNHFLSPEAVAAELGHAGLRLEETFKDVAGDPFDPKWWEYAVVARRPMAW